MLDFSKLVTRTGEDWQDGLPGRPAFLECKDKFGKSWRADFRFVEHLPEELWTLPESRAQAVYDHTHLTAAESKLVPRTIISTEEKAPPQSLRWRGARAMTPSQLFLRENNTSETIVNDYLNLFEIHDSDDLNIFRVKQLRVFLADKGMSVSGTKTVLVVKVFAYYLEHRNDAVDSEVSQSSSDSEIESTSDTSEDEHQAVNRRRRRRRIIVSDDSDE